MSRPHAPLCKAGLSHSHSLRKKLYKGLPKAPALLLFETGFEVVLRLALSSTLLICNIFYAASVTFH